MDDIVKILLGVLFLGFSIYSSSRKKKDKALKLAQAKKNVEEQELSVQSATNIKESVNDVPNNDFSFFDLLEKQINKKDNEFINTENTDVTEDLVKEEVEYVEEFDDHKSHSGLKIEDSDFISFDELNSNEEPETIDFDLKEAVIYSEILKPKYF